MLSSLIRRSFNRSCKNNIEIINKRNKKNYCFLSSSASPNSTSADSNKNDEEIFDETQITPKVKSVLESICELNMLEIHELSQALQVKFNMPDALLMGGGGGSFAANASGDNQQEEAKVEKTAFDVKLTSFDAKSKIKVIKEVRTITGLGLKEAKELVEGCPKVLKKDLKKDDAEALIEKLKSIGAVAELE